MQHYAVIGAGAAGLCAAKNLVANGIDATVFEAGSHIGGLWVYRERQRHELRLPLAAHQFGGAG